MFKLLLSFTFLLFSHNLLKAQALRTTCSEREKKTKETSDPIIIKTCFIKGFKFVTTSYPDYAGRYSLSASEVFVKVKNKYVATENSRVFNKKQAELLDVINRQIQKDFAAFKEDDDTKECLSDIHSVPQYGMNDLKISFNQDEIWFEVQWGLSGACRSVDGTIITFKLKDIGKYLQYSYFTSSRTNKKQYSIFDYNSTLLLTNRSSLLFLLKYIYCTQKIRS